MTRHGRDIAVVIEIAEFRHLRGETAELKDYLRSGPEFAVPGRPAELPRDIDWADEA